jgi:AbrB family looped-hinge helix DNA binding protein
MLTFKNRYLMPISKRGQITIPKDVREKLNLESGDMVEFTIFRHSVEFKKAIRVKERPFYLKRTKNNDTK